MTFAVSQEIYFLADDKVTLYPMAPQGLKSLADSLSHLKMTKLSISIPSFCIVVN